MLTVNFDRLNLSPGKSLLDVGCGEGRHVCEAYSRPGIKCLALDLDQENVNKTAGMLAEMEKAGMGGGGTWKALCGDSTCLPFEDASFDAIICAEVMEHIPDNKKAAKEIARVLKSGGVLAVSVPRYFPERVCWALSREYHSNPGGHIRIYKKREIQALIEATGLQCTGGHYCHALHSFYWWLKCACGVRNENAPLVKAYHRLLVWDIVKKPRLTRTLDRLLNPIVGKSLVLYFRKS
ncbi:MAG: class I SAM-dependent methyltransferase [Desulfatibacillaceae bacterium]|nr:class I SAM-dependent methyltransferase [Desulfatibacillaceae bacterium]